MTDLVLEIHYRLPDDTTMPESFSISGNVKEDRRLDVLQDFLRTQLGAGSDKRPPNKKEEFAICITVDLSCDKFTVRHDCGNDGLMTGIVMAVVKDLAKKVKS